MEQLINKLKKRLTEPLPGIEAQYKLAPFNRQRVVVDTEDTVNYRKSAVMILFCKDEKDDWFIPVTERVNYGGIHSGQISFPGGKYEESDKDLLNTAVRECYEEIGIKDIEPIGSLTQLYIPVSGFLVKPYIGFIKSPSPYFIPHEREVQQVLNLNLNYLMKPESIVQGEVHVNDNLKIKTPYIELQTKKIWGATAMILSELKEVILSIS